MINVLLWCITAPQRNDGCYPSLHQKPEQMMMMKNSDEERDGLPQESQLTVSSEFHIKSSLAEGFRDEM